MEYKRRVLIIDDHAATRDTLSEVISALSHDVEIAGDVKSAVELLEDRTFDLVLSDLKLPDGTGMDVLDHVRLTSSSTPVVMITGHGSIENAIEATRRGAYEYLTKPVDLNKLRIIVNNALHLTSLERKVASHSALDSIIGQSPQIQRVKELICQIAKTDVTVLIEGESGTGKELVASAIQALSHRADRPYVRLNIAALSKDLIESELFGHEKGAFSGAYRLRKGRFELADTGTLFLDEIGELRLDLQVKLLRVLQERELERVGDAESIPIDIRLIVATNCDLKKMVSEKTFREDLYFRINVVRILIPPLRERVGDIRLLSEYFLRKFCVRYNTVKQFSADSWRSILLYSWPGNIRELENAIEGAVVRSTTNVIDIHDLPEELSHVNQVLQLSTTALDSELNKSDRTLLNANQLQQLSSNNLQSGLPIEEVERRYILSELARLGGNKTAAAESLGIGLKTLYRKLEKWDYSENINL